MDSMETAAQNRAPFGRKVRTLVVGALAVTALSIPAVTAVGTAHSAFPRFRPVHGASPDSQRLALTIKPNSLRLT
jgi:hypothetical protein